MLMESMNLKYILQVDADQYNFKFENVDSDTSTLRTSHCFT